ncbi:MAG TPA: cytochrome C biosynthesis protein [Croceibacterium sp.]|nr:cytochrome C biosynthesis protein [Croceibacterium sp.]
MTWLVAIVLALAAFAVAVFAFRVERRGWTTIAAALALGLAGYALQASPGLRGEPATPAARSDEASWALVDERREMFALEDRSKNDKIIIADGFARRGQNADAAAILRGAVTDNPRDAEAWLALGNALVEHAGGALTEPALLAYRRAADLDPHGTGPGYFLGLALIRQGRLGEARALWQATLESAADDAPGREVLALRLERLTALLTQAGGPAAVPN